MLAGGKGERFWPLSRVSAPKQLIPLVGRESLLEQTVSRILPLVPPERVLVITSRSLERVVKKRLGRFKGVTVVGEPVGRNTAPAIAFASTLVSAREPGAITLVLPSDHVISTKKQFLSDVRRAAKAARTGKLVVFGVKPDRPETGYGYIEAGPRMSSLGPGLFSVRRFVEKPNARTARRLCRSRSHYWNSGMFLWSVDVLMDGLKEHLPSLARQMETLRPGATKSALSANLERFYSRARAISIDYGLLERSRNIAMLKAGFKWDDLGSWISLERLLPRDGNGNVSSGDVVSLDARDCVLFSSGGVVAALGVENLVVVRTETATLVCSKEHAQSIRRVSETLSTSARLKKYL
ncbi:MAG: mannose-1-phosphate guanylyltransferase [Candidatus Eiseniibacteriota bacterium]|nr:MAG: mannose-1-phosphate guanylyltransferase [Candidatus Eisenbacteria bacterium]